MLIGVREAGYNRSPHFVGFNFVNEEKRLFLFGIFNLFTPRSEQWIISRSFINAMSGDEKKESKFYDTA